MKSRTGGNLRDILRQRVPWLVPVGLAPNEPKDSPGWNDCKDTHARDRFIAMWIRDESEKWYSAIKDVDGQYVFFKMRNPAANRWANSILDKPPNTIVRFNPVRISELELAGYSGSQKLLPTERAKKLIDF